MDKEVDVILKYTNGNDVPVHLKSSDTVRYLLEISGISIPPNSNLICISKGNQLQLDLTLGVQGIESNDTIIILCTKRNKLKLNSRIRFSLELYYRMKELEKQQKELFEEALRVSDVSFLLFDYYRSSSNAYSAILRQQELSMQSNESNEETFDTIIQNSSDSISSEPLPPCWIQEDEANSEVLQ